MQVHIGIGSLYQEVTVENTGNSPLEFTTALHTYFRVSSIEKVIETVGLPSKVQRVQELCHTCINSYVSSNLHGGDQCDRVSQIAMRD